jgi:hypothetical protein
MTREFWFWQTMLFAPLIWITCDFEFVFKQNQLLFRTCMINNRFYKNETQAGIQWRSHLINNTMKVSTWSTIQWRSRLISSNLLNLIKADSLTWYILSFSKNKLWKPRFISSKVLYLLYQPWTLWSIKMCFRSIRSFCKLVYLNLSLIFINNRSVLTR